MAFLYSSWYNFCGNNAQIAMFDKGHMNIYLYGGEKTQAGEERWLKESDEFKMPDLVWEGGNGKDRNCRLDWFLPWIPDMRSSVGYSPADGTISQFDCKPKKPVGFLCSIWFVATNKAYSSQQTPSNVDLPSAAAVSSFMAASADGGFWCKCRELLEWWNNIFTVLPHKHIWRHMGDMIWLFLCLWSINLCNTCWRKGWD